MTDECPENFRVPGYAHGYLSQNFSWAVLLTDAVNMRTEFEVRSLTHSSDNWGYPKNWGSPRIRQAMLPF